MAHVSITRLRLRSPFYLLPFAWHSVRSQRQALKSDGCLFVSVRYHKGAFWTLTLWRDHAATRAFMLTGPHRKAMPNLRSWCDEASQANWEHEGERPTWNAAVERLRDIGRASYVDHPSAAHAAGNPLGSHVIALVRGQ